MISGFDDKLVAMIESHPSIIVGTCDRALVPTMARGFGARVISSGEALEVLVSRWPGRATLANIQASRRIAVTFTAPETFEAFQVKGGVTGWGECTPADLELSSTYAEVIRRRIVNLGEPPEMVPVVFSAQGLFRIHFTPEVVFRQTPGKNAGQRL